MKKTVFCAMIALVARNPLWGQDAPRNSVCAAMLLNIIPGFGVGSFGQGDVQSGRVQLIADVIGWGWLAGWIIAANAGDPFDFIAGGLKVMVGLLGVVPIICSGINGLLAPPAYYRQQMEKQESDAISIRVAPSIIPSANRRGFDVGIKLALVVAL
jgi:hypothetical protein